MVRKKFTVIDKKVEEMGEITDDLHSTTDKLEELYERDIKQREEYYIKTHVKGDHSSVDANEVQIDLKEIDEIFDKLESQEQKMAILNLGNIFLLCVLGLIGYIYWQLF